MEKKPRTITRASTGKTAARAPKKTASTEKKPTRSSAERDVEVKESKTHSKTQKSRATGLRIGAVICWLIAFGFEALAILNLKGVFVPQQIIPSLPDNFMLYLIIFLVVDLIFVIIGSQLWKKSNRIDPASKKNKLKFWLWNNMGLIATIIAFVPFIIILLTQKEGEGNVNLDAKTKKIVAIVAVAALAVALLFSFTWNPVSSEELAEAESEFSGALVYWTPYGRCFHVDENCQSLKNSAELIVAEDHVDEEGNLVTAIAQAIEHNRIKACSFCSEEYSDDAADQLGE